MGKKMSKMFKKEKISIVIAGLDSAGKTTILDKWKNNQTRMTGPTIGFNVETITHNNNNVSLWDISNLNSPNEICSHYYKNPRAIVFVVDSSDRDTIQRAAIQLHHTLSKDKFRSAVILVIANKQDLPNAMDKDEVTMKLRLESLDNRCWCVKAVSAKTGVGLDDAFDWIYANMTKSISHRLQLIYFTKLLHIINNHERPVNG